MRRRRGLRRSSFWCTVALLPGAASGLRGPPTLGAPRGASSAPTKGVTAADVARSAVASVVGLGVCAVAALHGAAPVTALGPDTIELTELAYRDTGKRIGEICAGRPLKVPGEKVAVGLLPKCVAVTAKSSNPNPRKGAKDAGVFGYVKTATGDSAIANNPDLRSDAGQFAMIPMVPPGDGDVAFEFVAVIPDSSDELGSLQFENVKAISYPGGARMAPLTACELDSLSDACDEEQEKFISK